MVLQAIQDRTGITAEICMNMCIDDNYMEFLTVVSQKLTGGDSVNVVVCWLLGSKVKVSIEDLNPLPPMGSNLHPSHQRL